MHQENPLLGWAEVDGVGDHVREAGVSKVEEGVARRLLAEDHVWHHLNVKL